MRAAAGAFAPSVQSISRFAVGKAKLGAPAAKAVDDGARQRFGRSESAERPRDLLGH